MVKRPALEGGWENKHKDPEVPAAEKDLDK